MEAKPEHQHDDVYTAVFALVGQKPNETYEGLTKILPSIKDADPAELKGLEARKVLSEMMKPHVDPLREEYEKAAAEEDVDDLSTEDDDWLGKPGEDDEELDENGIPVMKLSRASSSFILDGPGDVKVDNFTPEGDVLGDLDGAAADGATAAPTMPMAAAADAAAGAMYVPSAIARVRRESGAGTRPTAPVVTLEDEIRAMRAAGTVGAAVAGPTTADQIHQDHQPQQQEEKQQQQQLMVVTVEGLAPGSPLRQAPGSDEDEDDVSEAVPEPPGAVLLPAGGCGRGSSGGGAPVLGSSGPTPPGMVLSSGIGGGGGGEGLAASAAAAVAAAACEVSGPGEEATCSLPGTCQDTRHEDSLWAALQGVDGRALLEHLGLAGSSPPPSLTQDQDQQQVQGQALSEGEPHGPQAVLEGSQPQDGGGGEAAPKAPPVAANGHAGGEEASGSSSSNGNSSATEAAAAAAAATTITTAGGGDGAAAVAAETTAAAADTGASAGDRSISGGDVAAVAAAAALPDSSPSANGPTFEAVESFSLDPDFDYDNVQLTVREFPGSALNFRLPR